MGFHTSCPPVAQWLEHLVGMHLLSSLLTRGQIFYVPFPSSMHVLMLSSLCDPLRYNFVIHLDN